MPSQTATDIIDGLKDFAHTLGETVLPKPAGSIIDTANVIIDVFQGSDGTWQGVVSTVAGDIVGAATATGLEAVTVAAATIAYGFTGPVGSFAIFYNGSVASIEIARGVQTAVHDAALDGLNSYFPGELSNYADWMLDYFDNLFGPDGSRPVSNGIANFANKYLNSPIVFDLDNNGIQYLPLNAASKVFFDMDNDRFAEKTEWIGPNDGFLVHDVNANGIIDDQSEMFGDNGNTTAYAKLAALNTNNTGASANAITSADSAWGSLRVWQDLNGDGKTDAGELKTLSSLGITSISLQTGADTVSGGHAVAGVSTFVKNGVTQNAADALFEVDQLNSWYQGTKAEIDLNSLFLPLSRGYGDVKSLHFALSEKPALMQDMQDLTNLPLTQMDQWYHKLEAALAEWAGTTGTPVGNGAVNGLHLATAQAFAGEPTTRAGSVSAVEAGWGNLMSEMSIRFLTQGPLAEIFGNPYYDFKTDKMVFSIPYTEMLANAVAAQPADALDKTFFWSEVKRVVTTYAFDLGLNPTSSSNRVNEAAGYPVVVEDLSAFRIDGTIGNDTIAGIPGHAEVIMGGAGNDLLQGGDVSDVYRYFLGDGNDTIDEATSTFFTNKNDVIQFGLGIASGNLTVTAHGNDIDLAINGLSHITLLNQMVLPRIETITFADGTSWTAQDIQNHITVGFGETTGNDFITGTANGDAIDALAGDDTVSGLGGDDSLTGNDGNDSLLGGDGQDTLTGGLGNDRLFGEAGNDSIVGGDGVDYLNGGVGNDTITGDAGNDQLNGGDDQDMLLGGAGIDKLYGDNGNDTLTGGAGLDSLTGGAGADTFVFTALTDSTTAAPDQILDFAQGQDHIDLTGMGFTGIHAGAASGTELGFASSAGVTTISNTAGTFAIALTGTYTLAASDFIFSGGGAPVNHDPVLANPIADQTATAGTTFNFTVASNAFTDADAADVLTYAATKSDGTALPSWLAFNTATHAFSGTPAAGDVGTLHLKVSASDGHGGTNATDLFDIVIGNGSVSTTPTVGNDSITGSNDSGSGR